MEGIDEYRNDPILWAALVILDHVDRDDPHQCKEIYLHQVLEGTYEFIAFCFEEDGLDKPSKIEIISKALEVVAN